VCGNRWRCGFWLLGRDTLAVEAPAAGYDYTGWHDLCGRAA
jgi:hypothetical protein